MKLPLPMLEKLIELPSQDVQEIRRLLDDTGLEVKDVLNDGGRVIYNIETLANRGDTVSVLGIARELSARLLTAVKVPTVAGELPARKASLNVSITTEKCLRYGLLEMTLPKPFPLRSDVAQALGLKDSEHPAIVDLLNYVQVEIGQPMHAFDREKLDGEIIVALAEREEEVAALDGKSYRVPAGALVIRDRKKIVAIAGVIGCANSMVTAATTKIAVESACFDPVTVRVAARKMGISTDASYAFERGSDPEAPMFALRRLAFLAGAGGAMAKDSNGAHVMGLTYVESSALEKRRVAFSLGLIRREMNLPRLAETEVTGRLKNLGFQIETVAAPGDDAKKKKEPEYRALVPSWRIWDIRNPEDIVEEFARAHGLNNVKLELPPLDYQIPPRHPYELFTEKVEAALHGNGFVEIASRSFTNAADLAILEALSPGVAGRHVTIKNAIESNYSHLRMTALLHFARLAEFNHRKGVQSVKIYEFSRRFWTPDDRERKKMLYDFERNMLSIGLSGRWNEHEWRAGESAEELLARLKGVAEGMLAALGLKAAITDSDFAWLHPGKRAAFQCGRETVGVFPSAFSGWCIPR
jgi:phenylalanyl-tRNA synthetase beta chain